MLGYSSFISLEDLGRKISGLLTPNKCIFLFFFEFWLETGEFEEKVIKEVFWMGKKRANMAIFVPRPQVSLTISHGSIIFFPIRRHVSDVPFLIDELCRS